MRILVLSTHLYPCKIGGAELFHYHLIKALGKSHEVWVITACEIDFNQKNIHVLKIKPKKLGSQKLSIIYEHTRNILKVKDEIDIIHVPYMSRSWIYGCYLPALRKLWGIRYVLSLHGGAMLPWKSNLLHRFLFNNAAGIIAVSETLKREYERRSGRKIEVILPVLPFRESTGQKPRLKEEYGFHREDRIILYLGSIKKIKGSDILLDAFFHTGEEFIENNKVKLLYIGDGQMKRELEAKVKKACFERYVRFFGQVPHESVPDMYRIADIFVMPSLFEATSLSLLEAMFNGLPIIGTNTEGIANLIADGENGLLFEKNNCENLSMEIKRAVGDKELTESLGIRARTFFTKSFDFVHMVNSHLRVYEKAI